MRCSASARRLRSDPHGVGCNVDLRSHLAVDLNGSLDCVFLGKRRVELWPRLVGESLFVPQRLPEFFGHVGREGGQQEDELFHRYAGALAGGGEVVREFHHSRDGGVERELGDIVGDCADRLMENAVFFGVGRAVDDGCVEFDRLGAVVNDQPPDAVEETVHAVDALHAPRFGGFERAHEHFVQPERVGAVFGDDGIGVDDVAAALRHFLVVFAEDHALVDELLERLGHADDAAVVKHFVPESRVEQMQHGVLGAADV